MPPIATVAVGVAFVLDATVGEVPESVHPVAILGRAIGILDRNYTHPQLAGAAIALVVPVVAAGVAALPVWLLGTGPLGISIPPILLGAVAGVIVFTTVSLRMLTAVATNVTEATETDLETARRDVIGLVGRDTESLSAAEIRSAAVESLAENLADGLVAPLVAFALGSLLSLPVAVGAAVWVKAVNTLDSMLGYPDRAHGTASARLDDLVEWVPARLTAAVIALAAGQPGAVKRAASWARDPPSPNSGWPMAAMAGALDSRLHKPDTYDLNPTASLPTVEMARSAVRIGTRSGVLAFAVAGVIAWC